MTRSFNSGAPVVPRLWSAVHAFCARCALVGWVRSAVIIASGPPELMILELRAALPRERSQNAVQPSFCTPVCLCVCMCM